MTDIYFWRQLFIISASLLCSVSAGFMLAFPSVLNPAITSPNSTDIRTTSDHASWITAITGVGGLVGSFILSPILQILGRKVCHCATAMFFCIGFFILPFANNIAALYAARFIHGIGTGGIYIQGFIISEYVHPCRRGYFMAFKKVANCIGVLSCHVMSAFWTWRQIATFAVIPSLLAILITCFWPESPSHLALKGNFAACEKSFKWLNGNSEESQKQLKILIEAQREKLVRTKVNSNSRIELLKTFMKKDFQKPFLVCSVLTLSIDVCGRFYYMAYIIQIMTELMDNKASAIYFTFGADLLTLAALCLSSVIIRYAKRRTLLLTSGALSVLLMLLISLMIYLKSVYSFPIYFLWLTALIIILQSVVVNIGLIPVSFALIGEIFPLEHKGLGSFTTTFVFTSLYTVIMKITAVLIEHTKLYGMYAIFGMFLAICLLIMHKILPETKDKTLQQIEDELNNLPDRELVVMENEKLM